MTLQVNTSVLISLITEQELDILRSGYKRFGKIRNKIAHSNPKLEQDQYTFDELKLDLNDFEIDFGS